MLSSASSLIARTKAGRDALCVPSPTPLRARPRSSGAQFRNGQSRKNVSVSSQPQNGQIQGGNGMKSAASIHRQNSRAYHTTPALWAKKKETNVKSQATQGRRSKDKPEEESVLKLVLQAGPGAGEKVGAEKTQAERMKELAEKAQAAFASPTGLLVDQDHLPSTADTVKKALKYANTLAPVMERMKTVYPATWNMLRFQVHRLPRSLQQRLVATSVDWQRINADPEMMPFVTWMNEVEGIGNHGENRLRMLTRRLLMSERLRNADLWGELDALHAELQAELEQVDLLFGKPEEFVNELTPEELAELKEDPELMAYVTGGVLDDPEVQVVLSYFTDPRPEHDPNGVLQRAMSPDEVTEVDMLKLSDHVDRLNNILTAPPSLSPLEAQFPELFEQPLSDVAKMREPPAQDAEARARWDQLHALASEQLRDARITGKDKSPQYMKLVADFAESSDAAVSASGNIPLLVNARLFVESQRHKLPAFMEGYRQLVDTHGAQAASDMVVSHYSEAFAAQEEERMLMEQEGEDPDDDEVYNDILDSIDNVDEESFGDTFYPDYADHVTRSAPAEQRLRPVVTAEQRAKMLQEYKTNIDLLLSGQWTLPSSEPLTEVDNNLLNKKGEDLHNYVRHMLDISDVTTRDLSRELLRQRLNQVADKYGFLDQTNEDLQLIDLAGAIRAHPDLHKMPAEQLQPLMKLIDDVENIIHEDQELMPGDEELDPVGNPRTQYMQALESIRLAKDVLIDQNAELLHAEAQLDQMFKDARRMTDKIMSGELKIDVTDKLMEMHEQAYGKELEAPQSSVTSDDIMLEWAQTMKEDLLMTEARTAIERERDSIQSTLARQMKPLTKFQPGTMPAEKEDGFWPFSAEDIETQRPVEERIYMSAELPVEEIFSEASVGKYLNLSDRDVKRYLPEGFSTRLSKQEFTSTNSKALLIRKEALQAIDNLKAQLADSFTVSKRVRLQVESGATTLKDDKEARPMLLHGYRGCGKSAILSQIVYWARRSGWFVVSIPDGAAWLASGTYISKNSTEGTWDQPKTFVNLFKNLLDAHHDKLKNISIKTKVKVGKLEPKTLFDVVEYGSVLEQHAAQCFLIFKQELALVVEFPVLLAFDSYNVLYNPSTAWKDPESTSYYRDPMNPQQMSLGRLFHNAHLNPRLAYGTFIGALSEAEPVRRFLSSTPTLPAGLISVPPKYLEVPPYSMNEFTTVMEHYKHKNWVRTKMNPGSSSELYIYQLTSGFGEAIWSYTQKL